MFGGGKYTLIYAITLDGKEGDEKTVNAFEMYRIEYPNEPTRYIGEFDRTFDFNHGELVKHLCMLRQTLYNKVREYHQDKTSDGFDGFLVSKLYKRLGERRDLWSDTAEGLLTEALLELVPLPWEGVGLENNFNKYYNESEVNNALNELSILKNSRDNTVYKLD